MAVRNNRSEIAAANQQRERQISLVKNHRSRLLIGRMTFFH